jgi:HEAT repeat protein
VPFLIEHVTEVVLSLLIALLLANGFVVGLTIARRQWREKYFRRLDQFRELYTPVINALLSGGLDYAQGLQALREISGLDREHFLERLCLEKHPTPAQVPILRQLCEDLGLVKLWQRHLMGQFDVTTLRAALARPEGIFQLISRLHFLLRAKSADNLGLIRHQPSWPLLLKALADPHTDVQTAALRSLAAIQEPQSFSSLVERLHEVILKPSTRLSLRAVKSALVSFPLSQATELLPSLRHSLPRIRFLATDIIREMVEREAGSEEDFVLDPKIFPAELTEVFLTRLGFDDNPDVRARAAPVVARLADRRSVPLLLTLLSDPQWFVRLHTLRSLAEPRYLSEAAEIARHLTDANWMVREAAVRTLLRFGQAGINQLYDHFLESEDRYSQEQIADEAQRAGLIPNLLTQYAEASDGKERQVIERLVQMRKTSYLVTLLISSSDNKLRKKFLEHFGHTLDPQIQIWIRHLTRRETDPELRALALGCVTAAAS